MQRIAATQARRRESQGRILRSLSGAPRESEQETVGATRFSYSPRGLVTVAEGVETLQEWRMLQEFGCTLGQGWLIAKPMPAGEIVPWLKKHRAQLGELRLRAVGD